MLILCQVQSSGKLPYVFMKCLMICLSKICLDIERRAGKFDVFSHQMRQIVEVMSSICLNAWVFVFSLSAVNKYTVEPVYIEHSREMKKRSMYAGAQCTSIQVLSIWSSGEIETKSRVIR